MEVSKRRCPWCSAPLRVKDRALVGSTTHCPDCREPIRVVDAGAGGLSIERAGAEAGRRAASADSRSATSAVRAPSERLTTSGSAISAPAGASSAAIWCRDRARRIIAFASRSKVWIARLQDPLVLCWTAAIIFTVVMILIIKPWGSTTTSSASPASAEKFATAPEDEVAAAAPAGRAPEPEGPQLLPPETDGPPVIAKPAEDAVVAARPHGAVIAARPAGSETQPVEALIPERPPVLDVAAALRQPIRRYEVAPAVPLGTLLPEIEELAAVPIHADARQIPGLADLLAKPVAVQLKETTVGAILRELVRQVGLDYEIQPDGVHLRAKPEESTKHE